MNNNKLKFNYFDVGARGDIASPWADLKERAFIVGFEPDANEAKKLTKNFHDRKYFDIALWSERTSKNVYINEWESTSSMYPPNKKFIEDFEGIHWVGRKPKKVVSVNCDTIDHVYGETGIVPDYIKIDTQGAELEILKGAQSVLEKHSPLVTCETWCAEVYKGAPMMHEVIGFMHSVGYQVFDMELAAAWRHKSKPKIFSRRKSIGYEVLFVKNQNLINLDKDDEFIKLVLLLELYGYRDYALHLIRLYHVANSEKLAHLYDEMMTNGKCEARLYMRVFNKINEKVFKNKLYPNINY